MRALTHEEIARLLGVPMPAVKAWLTERPTAYAERIARLIGLSPPCPHPVHEDRSDEKGRAKKPREM